MYGIILTNDVAADPLFKNVNNRNRNQLCL